MKRLLEMPLPPLPQADNLSNLIPILLRQHFAYFRVKVGTSLPSTRSYKQVLKCTYLHHSV